MIIEQFQKKKIEKTENLYYTMVVKEEMLLHRDSDKRTGGYTDGSGGRAAPHRGGWSDQFWQP